MLDYSICKKLKEAGFPQSDSPGEENQIPPELEHRHKGSAMVFTGDKLLFSKKLCVKYPTLSELIGACGEKKRIEERNCYFWITSLSLHPKLSWEAAFGNGMGFTPFRTFGHTPAEAVANLYLKLHENN